MTEQPTFNFATNRERDEAVTQAAVWLQDYLKGRRFTPARQILAAAGLTGSEDNRRWLRRVRAATNGRVIGGPGMPGYCLLSEMSIEDFRHWTETMRSQAREMIAEVLRASKLYHAAAA